MVTDKKMAPAVADAAGKIAEGASAIKTINCKSGSVPINQAAVIYDIWRPTFDGEITGVAAWTRATAATAQVDVQINGVSVLTGLLTPATGDVVPALGTLVAARATRRFKAGDRVQVKCTTNGTGTFTDLHTQISVRPYPANGEV